MACRTPVVQFALLPSVHMHFPTAISLEFAGNLSLLPVAAKKPIDYFALYQAAVQTPLHLH